MDTTLIHTLDDGRRRAVENVRAAAVRVWARPLHRYYTDHTVAHSERVSGLLDGLTAGMMATDRRLSPAEVFILLAAAYLHDVGMQDERFAGGDPAKDSGQRLEAIRAVHHEVSAELIYRAVEEAGQAVALGLPDDPGLVEGVALVAKGHRQVDLGAAEYDPFVHGDETVRLRLLAALLRFGDALDIDHRRVDLEMMRLLTLPVESQLHWWRCHYVSGVSIVDETIRVTYRLPQERPDYEGLIVPLVEGEVRAAHAALEEIFRADAVKVALGRPQVRWMRLVQPFPPEVEALARERGSEGAGGQGSRRAGGQGGKGAGEQEAGSTEQEVGSKGGEARNTQHATRNTKQEAGGKKQRPTTVFDQRGQTVGTQVNVAGDYVERRSAVIVGDGNVVGDGSSSHVVKRGPAASEGGAGGQEAGDDATSLRRQLAEARENLRLVVEREAAYVLETDVPLQLVKEKRRLEQRIADLEARVLEADSRL